MNVAAIYRMVSANAGDGWREMHLDLDPWNDGDHDYDDHDFSICVYHDAGAHENRVLSNEIDDAHESDHHERKIQIHHELCLLVFLLLSLHSRCMMRKKPRSQQKFWEWIEPFLEDSVQLNDHHLHFHLIFDAVNIKRKREHTKAWILYEMWRRRRRLRDKKHHETTEREDTRSSDKFQTRQTLKTCTDTSCHLHQHISIPPKTNKKKYFFVRGKKRSQTRRSYSSRSRSNFSMSASFWRCPGAGTSPKEGSTPASTYNPPPKKNKRRRKENSKSKTKTC